MRWFWPKRAISVERRGMRVSLMVHCLVAGIVVGQLLKVLPDFGALPGEPARQVVELQAEVVRPTAEVTPMVLGSDDSQWIREHAFELGEVAQLADDVRLSQLAEAIVEDGEATEVSGENSLIAESVMQAILESEKRSAEENLERLEGLSETLETVSDEESVDALVQGFQKWMGTKPRAAKPAEEPVAGEFDFNSAQIHDVMKKTLDDGTVTYSAILVDAEGRQMQTEMTPEEGEQLHRVFALIKENPLLERIYRGVVMSLMDKMLQPPMPKQ